MTKRIITVELDDADDVDATRFANLADAALTLAGLSGWTYLDGVAIDPQDQFTADTMEQWHTAP